MPDGDNGTRLKRSDAINDVCPWSGKPIVADSLTLYRSHVVGFCNPDCKDKFADAVSVFDAALAQKLSRED